jgi:hypothetical protein
MEGNTLLNIVLFVTCVCGAYSLGTYQAEAPLCRVKIQLQVLEQMGQIILTHKVTGAKDEVLPAHEPKQRAE